MENNLEPGCSFTRNTYVVCVADDATDVTDVTASWVSWKLRSVELTHAPELSHGLLTH